MDASGVLSYSFAPRITMEFEVAKPALEAWSKMCSRMAVYEHQKDGSVASTHIHILMLGCSVKEEQFKRIFYRSLPGEKRKGNDLWSWEHKKYGIPDDSFLTYMSKGFLRPKMVKNFPDELVEERREQWVITIPKAVESSQKSDMYDDMCKRYFATHDNADMAQASFEGVRKWVFHWFYERTGKVPHATQYKQYAGSLYLKIGEKSKQFDRNADQVFSLWY